MVSLAPLPSNALLQRYKQREECFTDCYCTDIPATVSLANYVAAFYTTRLFKLERLLIRLAVKRPSTDADAIALGLGQIETFAAWSVEAREDNQLLLCDLADSTRSWLMVEPFENGTCLYFGSAVVPRPGAKGMGPIFHLLKGFHKLYSRALLASARRRLKRGTAEF